MGETKRDGGWAKEIFPKTFRKEISELQNAKHKVSGIFTTKQNTWFPIIFGKILKGYYAKKIDDFTSKKILIFSRLVLWNT